MFTQVSAHSPSPKQCCPCCSQNNPLFKAHFLGSPLKSRSRQMGARSLLSSVRSGAAASRREMPVPTYLGRACVLLVQQVVLPALVLVLLMINLQLLPNSFHTVFFHHLVLPYAQSQSGPAPAPQEPPSQAACPMKPHQPWGLPVTPTKAKVGMLSSTKGPGMDKQMPLLQAVQPSPAGTWRWGRAAWCPAWHCTGRATHAGNG